MGSEMCIRDSTGSEYEDFDLDKSLEEKDKEVLEAAHEVFHKEEV